jgi:hypothetical protein
MGTVVNNESFEINNQTVIPINACSTDLQVLGIEPKILLI